MYILVVYLCTNVLPQYCVATHHLQEQAARRAILTVIYAVGGMDVTLNEMTNREAELNQDLEKGLRPNGRVRQKLDAYECKLLDILYGQTGQKVVCQIMQFLFFGDSTASSFHICLH